MPSDAWPEKGTGSRRRILGPPASMETLLREKIPLQRAADRWHFKEHEAGEYGGRRQRDILAPWNCG